MDNPHVVLAIDNVLKVLTHTNSCVQDLNVMIKAVKKLPNVLARRLEYRARIQC